MTIDLRSLFVSDGASQSLNLNFDFSDVEYQGMRPFTGPVMLDATLCNRAGVVSLSGEAVAEYYGPCDRCGEECSAEIRVPLNYTLVKALASSEEKDGFIVLPDLQLDVEPLILSDLILAIPTKHLCSPECKGLCARCGHNLNHGKCACKDTETDPRLEALKQLLD
jgi:uncharacterized protein